MTANTVTVGTTFRRFVVDIAASASTPRPAHWKPSARPRALNPRERTLC